MSTRDTYPRWLMRIALTSLAAALLALLLALTMNGCAAPRDSQKHFARPKYEVTTTKRAVGGKPSVRQTWWKSLWFWQPRNTKYKHEQKP